MKKGFTLIELLVAIAICGVLAGIGIPMFNSYQDKAKKSALMANCSHAKSFIAGEMLKCEMNPSRSLELMKDGGLSAVHKVSCDPSETTTNEFMIAFINHMNNMGVKNPYGNPPPIPASCTNCDGGLHGIWSICRDDTALDCEEEPLAIDGRSLNHQGQVIVSSQPGTYQIACYYKYDPTNPRTFTTPTRFIDAR